MSDRREFDVKMLTRVEGEGRMHVRVDGDRVERVELAIYEPPRLFESLLVGREISEVPDITARICGICPVAYMMSSCHALEKAVGATPTPDIRRMRRLLYCGEWIESHALHMTMLHAPDFLGYASGIEMARDHRSFVEAGLRMQRAGNELLRVLGGRPVHPINVTVGGFHKAPDVERLRALLPELRWGRDAAIEALRFVAAFDFPDFDQDYDFVSLRHESEYPFNEGRIVSSSGSDLEMDDFESVFQERQVPWSTALQCVRIPDATPYLCGPLARISACFDQLPDFVHRELDACPIGRPHRNNYHSIVARAAEVAASFDEACRTIEAHRAPLSPARVEVVPRSGEGRHATEAPRGLLYHRYRIGDDGLVAEAKIVPPTSQNQARIESDLRAFVPTVLDRPDPQVTWECERLIRNYDPCISCATHFLDVTIDRVRRSDARHDDVAPAEPRE